MPQKGIQALSILRVINIAILYVTPNFGLVCFQNITFFYISIFNDLAINIRKFDFKSTHNTSAA